MRFTGLRFFISGNCLLGVFILLGAGIVNAQEDTIQQLKEVEITAQRINLSDIGKHSDVIDSQALALKQYNNLAAILAMNTTLFVRSYGNGTLATLGIRGGNASHTQLLWNGIPLRNPMIGLVDLALIPSSFIDEVEVHYGGHGAAFGSGAVGGLISLSNETVSQVNSININLAAGSWDTRVAELKLNYGLKTLRFSTRLFSQYAENNYRYKLSENSPERYQVHHRLQDQGLLQEMIWSMNERERITARLWYQEADRQIPPTSTQTTSRSAQQDKNLRMSLQWMRRGEKFNWQFKTAWLNETINYQDSLILLYTHNQFKTWLAEGETSFSFGPGIFFTGGLYTEAVEANSVNYESGTSRYQHAVFSSLSYIHKDWLWRAQVREEVTDGTWSPLLVDLSAEWSGIKQLTIKTSLSRNYRTPTLNDLYWRPGGNPGLVPEQGWTFETGLHYAKAVEKWTISSSLTAYTRTIDQWIMWMPPIKDVRNYWSPINISEVNSRGIEARGNVRFIENEWAFTLNAGLDLTWSTFGTPIPDFMISKGEQLFYVPIENFIAGFEIARTHWSGYYHHHWFGSSTGINEDVDAANIGNTGISYHFKHPELNATLYLQAGNVWNVPYRIIERRPMPGRSITGGVRLSFF